MLAGVRERLTYANVTATAALFLALTGGAWALTRNSVGPRQIQPNAVRSSDVRNQAIKGVDVNEATLGQVPSAEGAEHADSADSAASAASADTAATAQSANLLDNLNSTDFLRSNAQAGGDVSGGLANLQIDPDTVGQSELAPPEAWDEVGDADGPGFGLGASCTPSTGVTNFDSFHNSAAFYRDPLGTVHLKGLVTSGSSADCHILFVLPAGYRPDKRSIFGVLTSGGIVRLNIDGPPNPGTQIAGAVALNFDDLPEFPANTWLSLDGITFRCAPSGSDGCP
jgi:hypothetical protein